MILFLWVSHRARSRVPLLVLAQLQIRTERLAMEGVRIALLTLGEIRLDDHQELRKVNIPTNRL